MPGQRRSMLGEWWFCEGIAGLGGGCSSALRIFHSPWLSTNLERVHLIGHLNQLRLKHCDISESRKAWNLAVIPLHLAKELSAYLREMCTDREELGGCWGALTSLKKIGHGSGNQEHSSVPSPCSVPSLLNDHGRKASITQLLKQSEKQIRSPWLLASGKESEIFNFGQFSFHTRRGGLS